MLPNSTTLFLPGIWNNSPGVNSTNSTTAINTGPQSAISFSFQNRSYRWMLNQDLAKGPKTAESTLPDFDNCFHMDASRELRLVSNGVEASQKTCFNGCDLIGKILVSWLRPICTWASFIYNFNGLKTKSSTEIYRIIIQSTASTNR